ncbi:MAG TPA: aldo/keto reductase [Ktedonobacterales bacterium]|nr:aldo/keto reductase [Ktedonobacterales bacterium]
MQKRSLGRTGLEVVPFCLGGNVFGWTADEAASFAVLDAYVEGGGNFIDTADTYCAWVDGYVGGESETIIGRWMRDRGNRAALVIATKLGKPMGTGPDHRGLSRRFIMQEVEASLRRLQIDVIDLYQAHEDDQTTPLEETMGAFDELVRQGKVRAIGASQHSPERVAEALMVSDQHGYARYTCMQPPYNLMTRTVYEGALEALCQKEGLGVITYSSLASGFLTGKYRPDKDMPTSQRAGGIQQRFMNERGWAVLAAVDRVAAEHNVTPAQVALAWILARPGVTAPIASGTSAEQVRELLGAVDLRLSTDDIAALNAASA